MQNIIIAGSGNNLGVGVIAKAKGNAPANIVIAPPADGTVIGNPYCNGVDKYVNKANGVGGTYAELVEANSPTCGYVAPSSSPLLLDNLGAVTPFAVSTRKILAAYAGPCIRVRRSNDNVEADIGFDSNGDLNVSALLTHVGGNSGFVTTWYDQSGNGKNLVQITQSVQPRIVNAGAIDRISSGNTKPAVLTNGTSQYMSSGSFTANQPVSRSSVLQFLSVAVNQYLISSRAGVPNTTLYFSSSGILATYAGVGNIYIKNSVAANDLATVTEIFNGNSSYGSYNGAVTTGTPGSTGIDGVSIGNGGGAGNFANMKYTEVIVFAEALTDTKRLALEANQKSYFGTP